MTPYQAYEKAIKSGERIPELEPFISKNAFYSYLYAIYVIKGRFILAEPVISNSNDSYLSFYYAICVMKGKLPDFMHNALLLSNNEFTKQYVEFISKNP